jgi:hypothetical protein
VASSGSFPEEAAEAEKQTTENEENEMKTLMTLLAVCTLTAAYSARADIRLSDIDTNQANCAYARQEVSFIAADNGALDIRFVCVDGPVYDPRGVEYQYQLQVSIPDNTPVGQAITLGVINTNDVDCQKAQNELNLLNSRRVTLQFQCLNGPIQDEHSGQWYNYQLQTWLTLNY